MKSKTISQTHISPIHQKLSPKVIQTELVLSEQCKDQTGLSLASFLQKSQPLPVLTIRHIRLYRQDNSKIYRTDNGQMLPVNPQGGIDWQKYIHEKCSRKD